MSDPRCEPFEALLEYWSGVVVPSDAEALEDHVFGCASCTRRLAAIAAIATVVAKVTARRGGLRMVLTRAMVERLEADGLRMRHYRVVPGQSTPCTIRPDDDLLVTYLSADLSGVESVDVLLSDAGGQPLMRIDDAPIDAEVSQVIYTIGGEQARTFPAMRIHVQILAMKPPRAQPIAEYEFFHTPGG